MKILMIAPEPFFQPRGTPISVYQRLLALSTLGHEVDLVTYHLGEDVAIPGVMIHRSSKLPFINHIKPGPSVAKLFLDPLLLVKCISLLIKNKYDVIHSHEEGAFIAAFLAKVFGLKHLYDMHSSLPEQLKSFPNWNNPLFIWFFRTLEEMVLRSCDVVIIIGDDLFELVRRISPKVHAVKIENLPIQTAVDSPDPGKVDGIRRELGLNGKQTIVYTGTFEPYQGLDMLIDSAKIVVSQYPETLFLLIGGDEQQVEYYRQLADEKDLQEFFQFTGKIPATEVPAYLELASVLVSPRLEGTSIPLKVYTYLFSGKPMVATNIAAHNLALSDDIAILTAPNPKEFAQGILKVIYDPQFGSLIANKAANFAKDMYRFDTYLKKLDLTYKKLASENTDVASQIQPESFPEN